VADGSSILLTPLQWLLASLPIIVLLVTMVVLRWSAPRVGSAAWLVAVALGIWTFGGDRTLIALATAKGLSLSLFVLTIIWTSVYLYNFVERHGGIYIIGKTVARLTRDPLTQALLVGWSFSGFTQGVTGFGVPVALVAPLMVLMGFRPIKAVAIVMVGHAWAVTFGSLGSSYYSIQLVTGIPGETIGPHMAILFAVPIIVTGFAVAHIQGGWSSVKRGTMGIIVIGLTMAFVQWGAAYCGAAQIASMLAGLVGSVTTWILSRTFLLKRPLAVDDAEVIKPVVTSTSSPMGFHLAFLPYYFLISLSIISQIPLVKTLTTGWHWGLEYPGGETTLGFMVQPVTDYARIHFVNHPAPIIIAATALTFLIYWVLQLRQRGSGMETLRATYRQTAGPTVGVTTMVMMALVMADTGMTTTLANGIAMVSGRMFPILSPYIGMLGSFITGSNTNSNVMFGALQMETAHALGIGVVTLASTQSIGGSIGSAIAPAKLLVGTSIVGLAGQEGSVMRKVLPYCVLIVLLVGIQAWLAVYIFGAR
jgi:lactate permease